MKIEVGIYVRTKKGIIDKIIDVKFNDNYNTEPSQILLEKHKGYIEHKNHNVKKENNMLIIDDDTKTYWFSATEILKPSHNIKGLIEVGDFITYKQSNMYWNIPTRVSGRYNRQQELSELVVGDIPLKNVEITSILTKEQFEREAYKI